MNISSKLHEPLILPEVKLFSSVTLYDESDALKMYKLCRSNSSEPLPSKDEMLDWILDDVFGKTYHHVYKVKDFNAVVITDQRNYTWIVDGIYIKSFEV